MTFDVLDPATTVMNGSVGIWIAYAPAAPLPLPRPQVVLDLPAPDSGTIAHPC